MPASGEKNGLLSTSSQDQRARSILCVADLHQRAADSDAGDDLARDRAGGHPHRRLARARSVRRRDSRGCRISPR